MKKVGLILPPEVWRLAPHIGAQYAYYEATKAGLLPKPHVIIGCSAGAMAGASCLPWTDANFEKVARLFSNLRSKDVYSFSLLIEALALLTAGTVLFPLFDIDCRSRKKKALIRTCESAFSLGLAGWLVHRFFTQESLFSSQPLRHLMLKNLDFDGIFKSPIKLEVLTTDLEIAEEVVFSNHSPQDQNPQRFVEALLASARQSGRASSVFIDGKMLGDGGILGHLPIHRAVLHSCEVIFVFFYARTVQTIRKGPWSWPEDIIRSALLTEREMIKLTMAIYNLRSRLCGTKEPEIFFIRSNEDLPAVDVQQFNKGVLVEPMNIGYRAVLDNLPIMQKLVAD